MSLIEEARKKITDLEVATGNLEAFTMATNGSLAFVDDNHQYILESVVSEESAKGISKFIKDILEKERKEYEDKLIGLMGIVPEIKVPEEPKEPKELDIETIKDLVKEGNSLTEIGKMFNTTKKHVHDIMQKNGVSIKTLCP